MNIYMHHDAPIEAVPFHNFVARAASGINAVHVSLRVEEDGDPTAILDALRRIAADVEDRLTPAQRGFAVNRLGEATRWDRG